ncbi:NACHT domain-containing protein [Nocardia sp. NPDC003482]
MSSLLKPAARWVWKRWRPDTSRAARAVLADNLADRVRRQEERLRDQLGAGPGEFMHVEFTAVVARPHRDGTIESAEVSEIATYFDLMAAPRRMVILGEPGAGKTVAATHLMLGLLDARRGLPDARRAEEPVPVKVNAVGWDGTEAFSRWLATRLGLDYRLRAPIARALIDAGLVLPVLDGLDEMDPDHSDDPKARVMLDRLNETPWKNRPVVVACRSAEFDALARRGHDNGLHGATSITLKPFSQDQVRAHLAAYRRSIGATAPGWDAVDARLRDQPDGPLAAALRTPWMLALAASTLRHDPDTATRLLDRTDLDAVRDLLFTAQIPAAIAGTERTGPYRDYTDDNVRAWLLALAGCLDHRRDTGLDGTTIRLDQIWEIAGSTRIRVLHGVAVGLVSGLVCGLVLGVEHGFGRILGLTTGIGYGLTAGLINGSVRELPAQRIVLPAPDLPWWRRGPAVGSAAGLVFGLVVGLAAGPANGLSAGLVSGLLVGLVAERSPEPTDGRFADEKGELRNPVPVDETRLIKDDIRAAATVVGWTVVTFALLGSPMTSLKFGPTAWLDKLIAFLANGLAIGFVFGLTFFGASVRYFIATLVFRFTSAFPSRPRLFLDWARRSGLLRVTGAAYQFRHETYRLWLRRHSDPGTKNANPEEQPDATVL